MLAKKFIPLVLVGFMSPMALADDCGESTRVGSQVVETITTYSCNYSDPWGGPGTSYVTYSNLDNGQCQSSLPGTGFTYSFLGRVAINSEDIYEPIYDNAPIAGYRIQTGQHADGYGWARVIPQASDDNGISSTEWTVNGSPVSSSSLYFRNSSKRGGPLSKSIIFSVTDSVGQVCNANFNLEVPAPTCGTRGSNQGCN